MFENSKWINYSLKKDPSVKNSLPSPYIAKTFSLKEKPSKAILNICGYGEGAYYINGSLIPNSFRPTIPSLIIKTVIYNSYDITEMLKNGKNRIGIILGNYRCSKDCPLLPAPMTQKVILQLDITYADGTNYTLVSDDSFKAFESPLLFSDTTYGEIYDARKEISGWCAPDFDDSEWFPVSEVSAPAGEFRKSDCPGVVKYDENKGVEILPGLFDFYNTTSGYVRMKISGKCGNRIKLDYSERLTPDGMHVDMATYLKEKKPYPDMYNSAEFILNGETDKVFEALFALHGYRYVEVTGEYDNIELTAVTAHTDIIEDSSFVCDNKILNGIHRNCVRSIKTCCQGYWVDNPKRDAPWLGDEMLSAEAIAINFDSFAVSYENMMMAADSQNEYGTVPSILYSAIESYDKFIGPEWTDGVLFHVPYYTYKYTGNRKIVDDMWDSMNLAFNNFRRLGDGGYLLNKKGTGDWNPIKYGCSLEIAMTAYYRISALMMAELADATGRDATSYREVGEKIKSEFRQKYIIDGEYKAGHVSEFILAAYSGLLNEKETESAVKKIIEMVKEDGMAITFGTHGNRMFYDLLSEHGYQQFVFDVLTNDKKLGFAQQVKDGMTTLAERYAYAAQDIMSLNHHYLSHVDTWFYKWIAGIKINGFGYNDVVIEPSFVDGIGKVKANLHGIKVEYDKNSIKIDSPYAFTLKLKNSVKHLNMGKYKFSLD